MVGLGFSSARARIVGLRVAALLRAYGFRRELGIKDLGGWRLEL